jgi:ABC-type transport system involved in multi-copper enzyme maturation permease subunit
MKWLIWLSIATGYRSNSFRFLVLLSLFSVLIAWLASSFSARSPETLLLDVGLSFQRLVLTLMSVFWVQELYYKDLEKKTAMFLLAYPISRAKYIVSRFISVAILSFIALLVSALLLYAVMLLAGPDYQQAWPVHMGLSYVFTWAYFWLDIMVVVAFAFMLSSFSETPNLPVVCTLGFAIAMHAMGPVLDYLAFSSSSQEQKEWILPFVENVLYILPDLDRLDIRKWTLYGVMPPLSMLFWSLVTALSYILVFIFISVYGLQRREIS